jgi:hypothetical protein
MKIFKLTFYLFFAVSHLLFPLRIYAEQARGGIKVLIAGNLPEGSITQGSWKWDEAFLDNSVRTHVQPAYEKIDRQSFRLNRSIVVDEDSSIAQHIYLDPKDVPKGIMLKLFIAPDQELIFYWEGNEEAFVQLDEYINAWYMGFIPDAGVWVKLIIDFKELDMSRAQVLGMEFILSNGRAWWGRTIIENIS